MKLTIKSYEALPQAEQPNALVEWADGEGLLATTEGFQAFDKAAFIHACMSDIGRAAKRANVRSRVARIVTSIPAAILKDYQSLILWKCLEDTLAQACKAESAIHAWVAAQR